MINLDILPYLNKQKLQSKYILILSTLILFILFLLYITFENYIIVLTPILLCFICYWLTISFKNFLIGFLGLMSILPCYSWGLRYPFFHGLHFKYLYIYPFLLFILFYLFTHSENKTDEKIKLSNFDIAVFSFGIIIFFSFFRGIYLNGITSIEELTYLSLYLCYFFFKFYLSSDDIYWLWKGLSVITIIVSIEYILLAFSEKDGAGIFLFRVVTRQPHLAQFIFPLLLFKISQTNKKMHQAGLIIGIIFVFGMIFFSQQRGLWCGISISCFILLFMRFFENKRVTLLKIFYFFLTILAIIAILLLLLMLIDRFFLDSVFLTFVSRILSIINVASDTSWNIRASEINRALEQWDNNFSTILFGAGMGATINSIDSTRTNTLSVDNSYVLILWKFGIVGLLSFLSILYIFYKKAIYITHMSLNNKYKQLTIPLLSGFSGLLFIGFTNACLFRYRFIIIWALVFATIEVIYCQLKIHPMKSSSENIN